MLTGKQFGRYEVRGKLGAGGMGEVFLAHDTQLNRAVALKILSTDVSCDENRAERFRQEARAASALNHPNIITIYEIGESEHGCFIATELIDGETLREKIKRTPLSIANAIKISEQAAAALAAAHEAHIIHRDIKPENIMIRRDGYVKVLDFGLAKLIAPNENNDENPTLELVNTQPGIVMGSVRYMSPEQARAHVVDARTDIWSLGAVLYEMVTGRSPFEGETTSDTLAALIYKEPEQISHFVPNAPPELQRIIRKALRKDREERYQNIKDFALDLKNLRYEIEHETSFENKTQPLPAFSGDTAEALRIHQTTGANRATNSTVAVTSSAEYLVNQVKTHKWQTAFASVGVIALLVTLSFGFYRWYGKKTDIATTAFAKPAVSRIATDGKVRLPAMSPDGKYIAYQSGEIGNRSLVVRQIATDSTVTLVPASALDIKTINFSPDGNYVLYTQTSPNYVINTLYQVPTLGGTPKKLIEDVDSRVTFSPDGKLWLLCVTAQKKAAT
jgi:serine/threonine protein kinase